MALTTQDKNRIRVAKISLYVGSFLLIVKFIAYELTQSDAILSDALESVVNVLGALLGVITIAIASKPADADHPYGHGKAEHFSVAFEGGFITFAAILIVYEGITGLIRGPRIQNVDYGLFLTSFAGVVNGLLGVYLKRSGKKLKSQALVSGGEHLITDFITSLAVITGLLLVHFTGYVRIDSIVAILFGLYLARTGIHLFTRSFSELMDAEDKEVITRLGEIFTKHAFSGIIRIHHTRVLRSGRYHHIDAHVVVPEFWEIQKAHSETARFEKEVFKEYENDGEIHFHLDPCRKAYCGVCDLQSCPVRQKPFQKKLSFTVEELTNPEEPEQYR